MKKLRAGSWSLYTRLAFGFVAALLTAAATPASVYAVPPTANAGSASTNEDTAGTVVLSGVNNNFPGGALIFTLDTLPVHGSLTNPVSVTPESVQYTYTPAANYNGPDTFQFHVNDGLEDSAPAAVSLTVVPVNDPPVATDGSAATFENTDVVVTLPASDPADPGDTLTYSIVTNPAQGTIVAISGNTATYRPNPGFVGADSFTFKATDNGVPPLDSNVATSTLSVSNRPPVANAGPERTLPAGTAITINGSASDPDGDALSITWVQIAGPRSIPLQNFNTLTPTFQAPAPVAAQEVYGYRLNVTDTHNAVATSSMTITVTNGLPPQANAGADDFANEGTTVTLQGSGNDPDNQLPLTFQWTQIGGPLVSLSNPTILQPTFIAPHVSTETLLTFRLKVTDAGGNSVQDDVTWHVLQVGQALPQNPLLSDIAVYPSPFRARSGATIRYHLRTASDVKITIVDVFGRVVRELEAPSNGVGGVSGENKVPWDGRNGEGDFVGNGLYIVQVRAEGPGGSAKMNERVGVRN